LLTRIRKRPGSRATAPTTESLQLWTPLLSHLSASGVPLPTMLSATILDVISETAPRHNPDADEERRRELASYRWTLGTWLFWLWEEGEFALAEEERAGVLKRLARELVHNDEV
jgi:ribosomal biogenesis protein LAS1